MRILLVSLCLLARVDCARACGTLLAAGGRQRYHISFRELHPLEQLVLEAEQAPQDQFLLRQDWRLAQFAVQARLLRRFFRRSLDRLEERKILVLPYGGFVAAIDATEEELAYALSLPDVRQAWRIATIGAEFKAFY